MLKRSSTVWVKAFSELPKEQRERADAFMARMIDFYWRRRGKFISAEECYNRYKSEDSEDSEALAR